MAPAGSSSRAGSPSSPKLQHVADETLALLVQQFMDDWHYKLMSSSVSKKWQCNRVRASVLHVLALNGVPMEPCEINGLANLDEQSLVWEVVSRMSHSVRQSFETVAQQLLVMLDATISVRKAAEAHQEGRVQVVMEEQGNTTIGQQILKQAVLQASKEVAQLYKCQTTWVYSMEKRLDRMMRAAEIAEHTQQRLVAVEAQLGNFGDVQREKAKKVLMSFAESSIQGLLHSTFSSWVGQAARGKANRHLREKLEQEAQDAELKLMQYQTQQISNIRNILLRQAAGADELIMRELFAQWKAEVEASRREGCTAEAIRDLEKKLEKFSQDQSDTTKKVMSRWAADRDSNILSLAWSSWLKYSADYKKDKEFEEAVKKAEKQVQDFMSKKKDEAKKVLDVLGGATATGMLKKTFEAWLQFAIEGAKARELSAVMDSATNKMRTIQEWMSGTVRGVQTRVNEQANANLLFRVVSAWQIESKVVRVDKYYTAKMENKRKQLQSVQTLFKSFARQLEEGLSNLDGDSSGRTQSRRLGSKVLSRDGGAVSLPDIHARVGAPVPVGA